MSRQGRLLVVDDEQIALNNLGRVLTREGYEVALEQTGTAALARIEQEAFDIVLTDLRMEKVDGMELLKATRARHPDTEVIMITGYATAETAVEAMKQGAFYYIAKPFRLDEVKKVVSEAMQKIRLRDENRQLREEVESYHGKVKIITQDTNMRRLMQLAAQVAPTDCNVLITGESGTGKELLARHVHGHSERRDGPFVAVNCGAFTDDLLANELFGHEREAFTGATTSRRGLIEAAAGGTLFLDEITEMPLPMQVKLLRAVQEREVVRLGATVASKVDFRVIAATNRDIAEMVAAGTFRHDLYFRIKVVTLDLPPLSARRDDIPLLAHHFLRKFSLRMRKEVTDIAPEVIALLVQYDFPGNVRELENIIERGVAVAGGERIEVSHLPDELRELSITKVSRRDGRLPTLQERELDYILWVLNEVGGNQTAAAQALGINRSSLWRKLKDHNGGNRTRG
jgi:DNA-binding NtrC family response regulator